MNVKRLAIISRIASVFDHLESIKQVLPNLEIITAGDEAELLAQTTDADILLTWGSNKPIKFCAGAPSLKWIHTLSAGVDGIMTPEIAGLDIRISNTKGIHGVPIANHTLAYMLAFLRRFPLLWRQQQRREWSIPQGPEEIDGKTVGIIGLGSVGTEIARQSQALGMRVIATRRTSAKSDWVDKLFSPSELELLLGESDFVVLALPLAPSTRRFIGEKELSLMKKTAYLINIARGDVVDEAALIKVLQEGGIAGAGLDVFADEPLTEESPLWDMPNVIVTPHIASMSPHYMERALKVFCDNLQRYVKDEKLLYEVDKKLGY